MRDQTYRAEDQPPQATQPAFDKHFLDLMEHYQSVHAINLLGQKDAEAMLSGAYSERLSDLKTTLDRIPASAKASSGTLSLTPYDFHAVVKVSGHDAVRYDLANRLSEVADSIERYGWTAIDAGTGQIVERQEGVFRVNCLDWYVLHVSLRFDATDGSSASIVQITCRTSSRP